MSSNDELRQLKTLWLLVSDLDGTLLDHFDYSHEPVDELLRQLDEQSIPVIFNSSKTRAEIQLWRQLLNNRDPFIVENGSAIYLPLHYFPEPIAKAQRQRDFWLIELGKPRTQLLDWLQEFKNRHGADLLHYGNASLEQIMQLTGLNKADAERSMAREYSEPIVWRGDEQLKNLLIEEARKSDLQVLQGGRFLHLLGPCDKGVATRKLKQEFVEQSGGRGGFQVIALGDSGNDVAMLEAADIAGIIRSPVHEAPKVQNPRQATSKSTGPAGWRELVESIVFSRSANTDL